MRSRTEKKNNWYKRLNKRNISVRHCSFPLLVLRIANDQSLLTHVHLKQIASIFLLSQIFLIKLVDN